MITQHQFKQITLPLKVDQLSLFRHHFQTNGHQQ